MGQSNDCGATLLAMNCVLNHIYLFHFLDYEKKMIMS